MINLQGEHYIPTVFFKSIVKFEKIKLICLIPTCESPIKALHIGLGPQPIPQRKLNWGR